MARSARHKKIVFTAILTCVSLLTAIAIPIGALISGLLNGLHLAGRPMIIYTEIAMWIPNSKWMLYIAVILGIVHWGIGFQILKKEIDSFGKLGIYTTLSLIAVSVYLSIASLGLVMAVSGYTVPLK